MKHICYEIRSTDPAPAGDGDAKSWFEFYKWRAEGEQFVPVKYDHFKGFIDAEPGDMLWFLVDGTFVGAATIIRVETPSLPTMRQELWYDADKILETGVEAISIMRGRYIQEDSAQYLLEHSKPRQA